MELKGAPYIIGVVSRYLAFFDFQPLFGDLFYGVALGQEYLLGVFFFCSLGSISFANSARASSLLRRAPARLTSG